MNVIEKNQNDITIKTEKEFCKNECKDIGKMWTRVCPKCKNLIEHKTKKSRNSSVRQNRFCRSCERKGKVKTSCHRNKIKQTLLGRKLEEKHKENISKGGMLAYLEKRRLPLTVLKGKPSHRKGKFLTKEWKQKIRESLINLPKEVKNRIIEENKQRVCSKETRQKMRLAKIRYIEKTKLNGGQVKPAYNIYACKYFDELNKQNNWNLQHAENGGEFYVKELGYWVNAYDKERNIVVEYDEHYHNRTKQKEKDLNRLNEIKNHLKCKFFRYSCLNETISEY